MLSQIKNGSQRNFTTLFESLRAYGEENEYQIDLLVNAKEVETFMEISKNEVCNRYALLYIILLIIGRQKAS